MIVFLLSHTPLTFAYWKPEGNMKWNIGYATRPSVDKSTVAYNIDMESTPKTYIDEVHILGGKVICYFSAGTFESWRSDAHSFDENVKGKQLIDWPDERWLDVRSPSVRNIMTNRIRVASQKQCDAVDPDNVDGYQNPSGFPLTYSDQLAYNKFLMETAHRYNMSVSLKNNVDQIVDLITYADFHVNEECVKYNECVKTKPFITRNKTVFSIEYSGSKKRICQNAKKYHLNTLITSVSLDGKSVYCNYSN